MIVLAAPLGALIGLSLGALGGGGSILTVPALVYLLGQSPHAATTGSLLIVGVTSVAGAAAHLRAGRVRVGPGAVFGLLGVAGSYLGSRLSARVDPHVLLTGFAVLMVIAAAAMARGRTRGRSQPVHRTATDPTDPTEAAHEGGRASGPDVAGTTPPATATLVRPAPAITATDLGAVARLVLAASAVGLITGLFGVGGGFVIVPALVLALGFPMPAAVGTSLLVIAINSATALFARLGGHVHLDWALLGVFTVSAVGGSLAGNRVASLVDPARLRRAFTVLLVLVAAYTAARSLPHLI